jgi:tRNA-specific 2-thiouridylase
MRVLAAMSGGVDSSVAAALAIEAGHEVVGVTLKQWEDDRGVMTGCCTVADAEDARRVAAVLDIPYYVLDYRSEFRTEVVERFVAGYAAGRTPNPCIECNRRVRFSALFERARDLGCDALATGHHARVAWRDGAWRLLTAADVAKDQSYVLHMLGQDVLGSVMLPVGEMTKDEVRRHARRLGLRTASKPDSQDLCFVGPSGTRDFLRRHGVSGEAGPIVDRTGAVVGEHDGAAGFTIGQRRGVGVALGEPQYVTEVRPSEGVVRIGLRSDLESSGCEVDDMSFVAGPPRPGEPLAVKVRSHGAAIPAAASDAEAGWRIDFEEPVGAVAVGQAAVLYRGDEVVGGGPITRVAA